MTRPRRWRRRALVVAFAPVGLTFVARRAAAQAPPPLNGGGLVHDCRPCVVSLKSGEAPWRFTFRTVRAPAGLRVITEIAVQPPSPGASVQRLRVDSAPALSFQLDSFAFAAVDINFDGYRDLTLLTDREGGTATRTAYWVYEPRTRRFARQGEHTTFQIDSTRRRLRTYQPSGHGGLEYTAREYRWKQRRLALAHEEAQFALPGGSTFRRVVRECRGGRLRTIARVDLSRNEAIRRAAKR